MSITAAKDACGIKPVEYKQLLNCLSDLVVNQVTSQSDLTLNECCLTVLRDFSERPNLETQATVATIWKARSRLTALALSLYAFRSLEEKITPSSSESKIKEHLSIIFDLEIKIALYAELVCLINMSNPVKVNAFIENNFKENITEYKDCYKTSTLKSVCEQGIEQTEKIIHLKIGELVEHSQNIAEQCTTILTNYQKQQKELRTEQTQLNQYIVEKEKELLQKKQDLELLQKQQDMLQKDLQKHQERDVQDATATDCVALETELKKASQTIITLKKEKNALEKVVATTKDQLHTCQQEKEDAEKKLTEAQTAQEALNQELCEKKDELSQKAYDLKLLQKQQTTLQQDLQEHQEQEATDCVALETQLKQANEKLDRLKAKKQKVKEDLCTTKDQLHTYQQAKEDAEKKLTEAQTESAQKTGEAQARLKETQQALQGMMRDMELCKEGEEADLNTQKGVTYWLERIQTHTQDQTRLVQDEPNLKEIFNACTLNVTNVLEEVTKLETSLKTTSEKDLQSKLIDKQHELEQYKQKALQAEQAVLDLTDALNDKEEKRANCLKSLDKCIKKLDQLNLLSNEGRTEEEQTDKNQLENQLQDYEKDCKQAKNTWVNAQLKYSTQQLKQINIVIHMIILKKLLADKTLQTTENSLKDQIKAKNTEIEVIKQEQADVVAPNQSLFQELGLTQPKELEQQLQAAKDELQKLRTQLQQMQQADVQKTALTKRSNIIFKLYSLVLRIVVYSFNDISYMSFSFVRAAVERPYQILFTNYRC